ncbi:hypothetical protein, partial [Neoasaia chiangmaiensis]
ALQIDFNATEMPQCWRDDSFPMPVCHRSGAALLPYRRLSDAALMLLRCRNDSAYILLSHTPLHPCCRQLRRPVWASGKGSK